jgi:tellurite methyltransferase
MSREDRERWDRRHAAIAQAAAGPTPSLGWLPKATSGKDLALDLACGNGRHTLALLEAGYHVVAGDISRVALCALRTRLPAGAAAARVQMDVGAWPFARESFDLIVQIDFLDRDSLSAIRSTVKRGGLLLIDTFAGEPLPGHPGPQRREWRLVHGELGSRFSDWDILHITDDPGRDRAAILARRCIG